MSKFIIRTLLCPLLTLIALNGPSLAQNVQEVRAAGTFRVPLMQTAPKLDGRIEPAEWAASAGFDGFITLNQGTLERRGRGASSAPLPHTCMLPFRPSFPRKARCWRKRRQIA